MNGGNGRPAAGEVAPRAGRKGTGAGAGLDGTGPRSRTRTLTRAAVLIALGTVLAGMIRIPVGVATATPVQHAVNVLAAVWFGPGGAVTVAFVISLLRNLMGLGTLLAFPGSLIGAALAGLAYRAFRRPAAAMAGEVLGTGLLGGLAAFPVARWLLGQEAAAWFFYVVPFAVSSLLGALAGGLLLRWLPAPDGDGAPDGHRPTAGTRVQAAGGAPGWTPGSGPRAPAAGSPPAGARPAAPPATPERTRPPGRR